MRIFALFMMIILFYSDLLYAAVQVQHQGQAHHDKSGLTIVSGTLELPSDVNWMTSHPFSCSGGISQIFIAPQKNRKKPQKSRRLLESHNRRKNREGRYALRKIYSELMYYAATRNKQATCFKNLLDETKDPGKGKSTTATDKIDTPDADNKSMADIENPLIQSPYFKLGATGAAYAWLPGSKLSLIMEEPIRIDRNAVPVPVIVEIQPYSDDGKHWVLYSNGDMRRVEIDRQLMSQNGLAVTSVTKTPDFSQKPLPAKETYQVFGIKIPGKQGPARFRIEQAAVIPKSQALDCIWQPKASQGHKETDTDTDIIKSWASIRAWHWWLTTPSPILKHWAFIQQNLFDVRSPWADYWPRRNAPSRMSLFGVLGGQAAMMETFQLENLEASGANHKNMISVDDIKGVEIASLPFGEMLNNIKTQGGQKELKNRKDQLTGMPLTQVVPMDNFMIHIPDPGAILPYITQGSPFLSHIGSMALGRSLDYDLCDRYLNNLGLSRNLLEQLLRLNIVQECVLFTPDLFFIDGTDVTIAARVPQMEAIASFLAAISQTLDNGRILALPTSDNSNAYWCWQGDLLFISTRKSRLKTAMTLKQQKGKNSLGQSDEFKYMQTQLPHTDRTRAYLYFSDSFIRRLVSPATKIGQLRRLKNKAHLQLATSAALLYQMDQQPGSATVPRLMELGYLPEDFDRDDIELTSQGLAVSKKFGSCLHPKTLAQLPITKVSQSEANAYQSYVEFYQRYWDKYFDPVAVRLDKTEDDGLALTTFILPLLENSIYNLIRSFVPGHDGPDLRVPKMDPAPLALFSLNLADKAWIKIAKCLNYHSFPDEHNLIDQLGPGLHFAIQDGDPVLAFGSGELIDIMGVSQGLGNLMAFIPMAVSVLTRPCTLFLETQNPDAMNEFVENGGLSLVLNSFDFVTDYESYQVEGKKERIFCAQILGMAQLRFGVSVQDRFLVINNRPWSQDVSIPGSVVSPLGNLALHLEPAAVKQQRAAMFTSSSEKQRHAAMDGYAMIIPIKWSGGFKDISQVLARHRQLFGFAPRHPAPGSFQINEDQELISTAFGLPSRKHQARYKEGRKGFGVLDGINPVQVSMQIENTGLRTRIYWKSSRSKKQF